MRIIGLTGSIASGKSTVSEYLISRGFPVIDGDRLSRELTCPGSPVLAEIRHVFGPDYFSDNGMLNRRRLGRLVFSDPSARNVLDHIMAPHLLSLTRQRINEIRSTGASICFLDMPLLFEKGYDKFCDSVWSVWIPENIQITRLINRDGFTKEEAVSRIRTVLSSDEKAALADKVIDNSGSVDRTYAIVSNLLASELSETINSRAKRNSNPYNKDASAFPQEFVDNSPSIMERPESASIKKTPKKSEWQTPVWLKSSLICAAALLLICITAISLMNAYLRDCQDRHLSEQESIDKQYPLLYRELIEKYAADYNLCPAFVSSVIRNESSFQPKAESGVGARGLMQLMPDTAEWIAGKLGIRGYAFERMLDPESNILFGCWYLNYLSSLYMGDPVAVTAAYHAGQGQVKVWLSDPLLSENGYSLPLESLPEGPTKNYARKVLRDYGIYQKKYFENDDMLFSDPVHAVGLSAGSFLRNR